jgi:alanine dehydrogenase
MLIGIPKEVKNHEYRVGATPDIVKTLILAGHLVLVQAGAGMASGFTDQEYEAAGAKIVGTAKEVYEAEMIIKVKEPQASEFPLLKEGQILFCYLHLAPDPEQTKHLLERKVVGIAYETVTDRMNRLPLLVPMSEIAGRLSVQIGATYLQMANGGRGVLLGGVPGVAPGRVVVIGGGVSGTQALRMALGLGANVTVFDNNLNRLRELESLYSPALKTVYSSHASIFDAVKAADLVIGAVLVPGKLAPKIVTREMISHMRPGSVIVDIAIDQGGCFETARPTSHSQPTYLVDGVVHYCVTNMPGAVARTSTFALTNATSSYALKIAGLGYKRALLEDPGLMLGLNVYRGHVTHPEVARDLGYELYTPNWFNEKVV